jgi:hypothetical protein
VASIRGADGDGPGASAVAAPSRPFNSRALLGRRYRLARLSAQDPRLDTFVPERGGKARPTSGNQALRTLGTVVFDSWCD